MKGQRMDRLEAQAIKELREVVDSRAIAELIKADLIDEALRRMTGNFEPESSDNEAAFDELAEAIDHLHDFLGDYFDVGHVDIHIVNKKRRFEDIENG